MFEVTNLSVSAREKQILREVSLKIGDGKKSHSRCLRTENNRVFNVWEYLEQIEISKKLGITQPAISQYKQRVRGSMAGSIHLNESLGKYIDSMINEITESDLNINTKICRICEKTRESGVIRINPREFLCLLEIDRPSSD